MNHLGDTNKMVGEDHIRDATKMVSDTPRTDAVNQYLRTRRDYTKTDHEVWMNHGIQIERELNAANDRIKRLDEESESRWMLAQSAIGSCAEMSSRIKRLEEAGDKMFWTLDAEETGSVGKEMWRKAKEDEP